MIVGQRRIVSACWQRASQHDFRIVLTRKMSFIYCNKIYEFWGEREREIREVGRWREGVGFCLPVLVEQIFEC